VWNNDAPEDWSAPNDIEAGMPLLFVDQQARRASPRRAIAIRLTLLLATALGVPASTSALPSDMSDLDADTPRQADAMSASPLLDSPAAPAPVEVKSPEQPPAATKHAPSANPLWAIPLAILSNTRERPIFSPSRRPPPPAAASVPVSKAPLPQPARVERPKLSLVGTIISDDRSFGIFVDQSTNAALRLRIGEDYQGWKLRSVQGRKATLERDQQTAVLSLPQPGAGATGQVPMQVENVATVVPADPPPRDGGRH
jgi:general secretion pathway protein N